MSRTQRKGYMEESAGKNKKGKDSWKREGVGNKEQNV